MSNYKQKINKFSKKKNFIKNSNPFQSFLETVKIFSISWPRRKHFFVKTIEKVGESFIQFIAEFNKFLLKKSNFFYKIRKLSVNKWLFFPSILKERSSLSEKKRKFETDLLELKESLYQNRIDDLKKLEIKIKEELAAEKEYNTRLVSYRLNRIKGKPTIKETRRDKEGPYVSPTLRFARNEGLFSKRFFIPSFLNMKGVRTYIKKRYQGQKIYKHVKRKFYVKNNKEVKERDRFFFNLKEILHPNQENVIIENFFFNIKKKRLKPRKIRLSLFKNIILSDFFLINKKRDNDVLIKKFIKVNNNKIFFLDVLKLTKEIRQLCHIFWEITKTRRFRLNKKQLFFLLESENHSYLANKFFKKIRYKAKRSKRTGRLVRNLVVCPVVKSQLQHVSSVINPRFKRIIVSSSDLNTNYMLNNLARNKIFLASSINTKTSSKTSYYSIFNNLDNIKKLYFLLSLSATFLKNKPILPKRPSKKSYNNWRAFTKKSYNNGQPSTKKSYNSWRPFTKK